MISLFFKGIIFGVANIIPGVSGGTIAIALNIFDKLLNSINTLFKEPKKSISFLIPLGLGAVFGIIFFSSIISFGMENYSFITAMLFIGLVTGSIPMIYDIAKKEKPFTISNYVAVLLAFVLVFIMSTYKVSSGFVVEVNGSISTYIYLFICGIIASSAMIIPGISGSFVMILLGVYTVIINTLTLVKTYLSDITNFSILVEILQVVMPIGIGICVGIFLTSKLIEKLFEKNKSMSFSIILGLILGSIYSMFSDPETYSSGMNVYSIIFGIITFVIGYIVSQKFNK